MFVRGQQVAYVPMHVPPKDGQPDLTHPDVQFGFVTSGPNATGAYFVRYWNQKGTDLRTKSCSECTDADMLVAYDSHSSLEVTAMLAQWC